MSFKKLNFADQICLAPSLFFEYAPGAHSSGIRTRPVVEAQCILELEPLQLMSTWRTHHFDHRKKYVFINNFHISVVYFAGPL